MSVMRVSILHEHESVSVYARVESLLLLLLLAFSIFFSVGRSYTAGNEYEFGKKVR
jgi:hypothetical protein